MYVRQFSSTPVKTSKPSWNGREARSMEMARSMLTTVGSTMPLSAPAQLRDRVEAVPAVLAVAPLGGPEASAPDGRPVLQVEEVEPLGVDAEGGA